MKFLQTPKVIDLADARKFYFISYTVDAIMRSRSPKSEFLRFKAASFKYIMNTQIYLFVCVCVFTHLCHFI